MDRLAEEYSTNERIRSVMDRVEFYIVPIVNPDGYDFTWTPNNRLWRKSRRTPPAGSTCFGVDLNRNWGFQWGLSTGSSGSPCSDTYRGAAPFSEPETTAMKNLIDPIAPRLRSHLDMHSNAQKFLSPWGYTTSPAPIDLPLMDLLGARMRAGILPYRNTAYEYGQGSVILYLNSGNARDYTYGTHRRMAWTWESTNSTGGFAPAASEIRPTSNESLDGFLRLAEYWAFPIVISLPGSAPALLPADAASELRVSITNDGGTVSPGTARLFTRVGATGAFTPAVMSNPAAGDFRGQLPAAPCGSEVQYYVEASTTAGETVRLPAGAPGRVFSARAADSQVLWSDACEAQGGWSLAAGSDTATAGRWVNAAPSATPAQPGADASPAPGTRCFITNGSASNNALDFDLDGGTTTLTGPSFSAAAPAGYNASDVFVAYSRWFSDNRGNAPDTNDLVVQISNDNGSTWTTLETVTADADAWVRREFRVSDFVAPTATMRLRFIARDSTNALVEAGIDEVSAFATRCGAPACPGDWNGDGVIDFNDLLEYLNDYNAQAPRADINLDGIVDFNDLLEYLNLYNAPC
jgi:hypothetical protein